jgi:hypothetical protein
MVTVLILYVYMHAISAVGWFLANQYLSLAVAFPIVTAVSATEA